MMKNNLLRGSGQKWAMWQASEASNHAERRVRKMRFMVDYEQSVGKKRRKVGAALGRRKRRSANRIPNERAKKIDRRKRRQRQINDSMNWTIF